MYPPRRSGKLGIWLSVDSMADKYPGWSPYNYCMNNPVNYTDPHGDTVKVDPNLSEEDDSFVMKYLAMLKSTEAGKKGYDSLHNSSSVFTLTVAAITNSPSEVIYADFVASLLNGTVNGGTIRLDKKDIELDGNGLEALSHEVGHALDALANKSNYEKVRIFEKKMQYVDRPQEITARTYAAKVMLQNSPMYRLHNSLFPKMINNLKYIPSTRDVLK